MKITQHCFAVTGLYFFPPWSVNAGFIVGSTETLVVDSGGSYIAAQTIYGYSKNISPNNAMCLINTEKHLDHIGGNSYFNEKGIKIIGHHQINRNQNEFDTMISTENENITDKSRRQNNESSIAFAGTKIVNPNEKIYKDMTINLGEIEVNIILTPGHTITNLCVFVPSEKAIYTGDCISEKHIPNVDEADKVEWYKSLTEISKIKPEVVIPGHGNVIYGNQNIEIEINRIKKYLSDNV